MAISIPFTFCTDNIGGSISSQTQISTFLKAGAAPSGDTTIFDMNWGTLGYLRLKLTSTLNVIAETTFNTQTRSVDLNGGTAIVTGGWYWASVSYSPGDSGGFNRQVALAGQMWGPQGTTAGYKCAGFSFNGIGNGFTYQGTFGWGVSMSSAYDGWPNSTGWELSKGLIYVTTPFRGISGCNSNTVSLVGPPNTDWTSLNSNFIAYWKCRDALGAESTIVDSSGNGYSISAGSLGLTIVTDGPYP